MEKRKYLISLVAETEKTIKFELTNEEYELIEKISQAFGSGYWGSLYIKRLDEQ